MKSKELFEFRVKEKEDSSIEVLKFCSNGDVYIKSEKVDSNKEIYTTFKKWLLKALDEVNLPQVIINNEKYKFE
ncbi:MAG: hypothetical protein ACOC33_00520 [bacterium]